jgi:uncharacterized protein
MRMVNVILLVILGLAAGILSGLIGVGGGIIIIPALALLFGMTQHQAQGTTLALFVPPIGILAAWIYYKEGNVDLTAAACLCIGFVFGSFFGAKLANTLSNAVLTKSFGSVLLLVSLRMLFGK